MKKTLLIVCLMLFSVVLVYGTAGAVTGACANCHTMHNSQDGAAVAKDGYGVTQTDPLARLLKAGCVSCHMAGAAEQRDGDFGPKVLSTAEPASVGNGATNAGGDFYWVNAGSDSYGHNVIDLPTNTSEDGAIGTTPPGWDASLTVNDIELADWSSSQLSCAGATGCHGTHAAGEDKWDGVKGAHHSNVDGELDAGTTGVDTVGNSFRFLIGIEGYEDSNWEWNVTASTGHNNYKGGVDTANRQYDIGTTEYSVTDSISYLCAECHGAFHAKVADASTYTYGSDPWRRHPTDIVLPDGGEYSAYTTYNVIAPIGRQTITTTVNDTVTPGTDVVICLSCHRAHGSDQPDLLRWSYDAMTAGSAGAAEGTGCFVCHTTKD